MRSYNRFTTDHTVHFETESQSGSAALYNLSSGGCMIELSDTTAEEGAPLIVTLKEGIEMPGHIVWRIGKNAGIKFEMPLHTKVVETFGYDEDEVFDRNDPRDRFGIPLVETRKTGSGYMG